MKEVGDCLVNILRGNILGSVRKYGSVALKTHTFAPAPLLFLHNQQKKKKKKYIVGGQEILQWPLVRCQRRRCGGSAAVCLSADSHCHLARKPLRLQSAACVGLGRPGTVPRYAAPEAMQAFPGEGGGRGEELGFACFVLFTGIRQLPL